MKLHIPLPPSPAPIPTGDAAVDAARKAGGIARVARVASIDQGASRAPGPDAKFCTIVKGE